MPELQIKLLKSVNDELVQAAAAVKMEREEAFEYVVRNALKFYYIIEQGGHYRLIHPNKRVETLHFESRQKRMPGQRAQQELAADEAFEVVGAAIDSRLFNDLVMEAAVFGYQTSDLINRLVTLGSHLAIHLQHGAAFGYTKSDEPCGKIEFTRS